MLEHGFHLPDDLGPHSLDLIEVVMAYEEAFDDGVSHQELKELSKFHTERELMDYFRNRKKGNHLD